MSWAAADLELGLQPHGHEPADEAHNRVSRRTESGGDAPREQEDHAHDGEHRRNREDDAGHTGRRVSRLRAFFAEAVGVVVVVAGSQAHLALGPALALDALADGAAADAAARVGGALALVHVGGEVGEAPVVAPQRDRAQRGVPPALGPVEVGARLAVGLVGLGAQVAKEEAGRAHAALARAGHGARALRAGLADGLLVVEDGASLAPAVEPVGQRLLGLWADGYHGAIHAYRLAVKAEA